MKKEDNKIEEVTSAGDVATFEKPIYGKSDGSYRNKTKIKLNKKEFRDLIKKNIVPKKVMEFAIANKTVDIYMTYESGIVMRLDNFIKKEDLYKT